MSECGNVDMSILVIFAQAQIGIKNQFVSLKMFQIYGHLREQVFIEDYTMFLGGSLSAINGIGTEELTINKLIKRIEENEITEVILALSTTMEGQTTTHVIADKLETFKKFNSYKISTRYSNRR